MPDSPVIVLAQINVMLGAIDQNADKIIAVCQQAAIEHHADCVIFPELVLTGYPPEDLIFRKAMYQRIDAALARIKESLTDIACVIGYPYQQNNVTYNQAAWIEKGEIRAIYQKQCLPNYSVFDELRYFTPGSTPCVVEFKGKRFGLTICEDLWDEHVIHQTVAAGADVIISINASPFAIKHPELREQTISQRARESNTPILYCNLIGGQDELVFDGGSMVFDQKGQLCQQAAHFKETLLQVTLHANLTFERQTISWFDPLGLIYNALVLGVKDYVHKNNFPGVVIGLSGGIDSALTLAIAVDALGKDAVHAVMMPSRYTSKNSFEDADQEIKALDVHAKTISIEPVFNAFLSALAPTFKNLEKDSTEENLQARCRGMILMAISNKKNLMVLSTGNKSEMSVGYATLYGDMAGGFAVIKDVFKTLVYQLAHYRNTISPVIPERVLKKAPTAELADNQKDEDTLPPYELLDAILSAYIENDRSLKEIIKLGFPEKIVHQIIHMINKNEYKRRQAPPGVRITHRAFGRDRRYPITSAYK